MRSCTNWSLNIMYFLINAISLIGFTYNISYYFSFNHYFETQCLIKNITYPKTLNNSGEDLWQRCRCDDHCYTERPCVRLYTTQPNSDVLAVDYIRYEIDDKDRHCTFNENKCRGGDEPGKREEYLSYSLESVRNYRNKIVKCFRTRNDESPILLNFNIEYSYISIIVFGSILAFLGIIAVIHRFYKVIKRFRILYNL